jgi:predicted transcriptional regulator
LAVTRTQAQIVELIAQLTPAERRELFEHVQESGLLEDSYYSRMTPEQLAQLDEGIAQADRGEIVDGREAFDRLAARFGFRRA